MKTASKISIPQNPQHPFGDDVGLQEKIRLRAYELYEQRGRGEGHDLDDWFQAETELIRPRRVA